METVKVETRGRKKFIPQANDRTRVMIWAACGMSHEYMCSQIINPDTNKPLSKKTLESAFKAELERGASEANAMVAQSLFKKAIGSGQGSVAAAVWWEKTRSGKKDTSRVEHTGADGKPLESTTVMTENDIAAIASKVREQGEKLDKEY